MAREVFSPKQFEGAPYAVVLLDEVEKAHGDVLEMFYQVFDKGTDFKNTIIIVTTNATTDTIMKLANDSEEVPARTCWGKPSNRS
jgi:type VI secretion system protein VasG